MIEINLLCLTTNGEQRGPDASSEETYQTILRKTMAAVDDPQVHLSDVSLDPSTIEVVILHSYVDKCSCTGL